MSDGELESPLEPSDPETQFIPQEDDHETLWEVIEITSEKGKLYKVRWKGNDPKTHKPWPQSWVAKHDCTADLVRTWKLKQAKKKKALKRESGISKKSRTSIATIKSPLTSKGTASPANLDSAGSTRRSTSTTIAVSARRGRPKISNPSPSIHDKRTRLRKLAEIYPPSPLSYKSSVVDASSTPTSEILELGSPPNPNTTASTPTASTKTRTKRKHGETTSTTTSARISASSTFPTAGAEGAPRTNSISGSIPPPRKKRKLEVEPVKNYEHSSAKVDDKGRKRQGSSRVIDNSDDDVDVEVKTESDENIEPVPELSELQHRKSTSPSQTEEEEADERMIEESLSDVYHSPRPSKPLASDYNQEDEGTPTPPVRAQSSTHRRQDVLEETTPTVSRPQREMNSPPANLARITPRTGPPTKKSTRPTASSSSSTAAIINPTVSGVAVPGTTTKFRIMTQAVRSKTTTGAKKRMKTTAPTVSTQKWEELNDFQSQQEPMEKSVSEEGPNLEDMDLVFPVMEPSPLPSPAKPVSEQVSGSKAESAAGSGSHSLTKRTKSIPPCDPPSKGAGSGSSDSSAVIVIPTTPPRNRDDEADGQEDGHRSPILSPGAKKRLEQFDRTLMEIASVGKRKGKGKEQQPEDGVTLGKVDKGKQRDEVKDVEVAVAGGDEPEDQERRKGKSKSKPIPKEARPPPNPVLRSHDSDSSKSKSKERGKEQLNQHLPSHHAPDSEVEPSVKSDDNANTRSGTKWKAKDIFRYKPRTKPMTDTEEEAEGKEDNSSSTRTGTTNAKLTDICNATSKIVSKTISKPQTEDVTNITQAKPPSSTTTVRRSANPRSNSFVNDVVPETEESSQSQEMQVDLQVPQVPQLHVPPATPSTKSTLKSRMKPKTPQPKSKPLSRTSSAVGALALGVRLDMDVGVGDDIDKNLDDELDNVKGADEPVKKTSNKKTHENGTATTKPFGPIPRISPSTFKPHLPSSSLPESIVDSIEGDGDDAVKRATNQNEEDDSIEQFESPVKASGSGLGGERRVGVLNAASRQEREKPPAKKESASDIWNSDLNRRGQELAEIARRKRERERLRVEEKAALPASTLTKFMPQAKDALLGHLVTGALDRLPDVQEEETTNPDVSMQSLPLDVILPPEDTNSVVQQMEDAYVDLSGGVREGQTAASAAGVAADSNTSAIAGVEGSQSLEVELTAESNDIDLEAEMDTGIVEQQLDPIQEEEESTQDLEQQLGPIQEVEESTQDLMMESQQTSEVEQSGYLVTDNKDDLADLPPAIQIDSQPIIESMLDEDAQERDTDHDDRSDRFMDEIPSIIVEKPSRAPSARSYSPPEVGNELSRQKVRSGRSKSRSRSRSPSSQNSKNEELDPEAEIPATASTHRESLQVSSQPTDSQTESVENPHHLGAAMHLLNAKSEEISKLEGQLSAAQGMNEELLQQLSALRLQLTESTNDTRSATKTAIEQELAETRAQLALQTASWENERVALALKVETATRGKVSAEEDRDFFREQYARSSAFVSSVRDENSDLEKRIKIATDQAQSGVTLIKSTFELRTKSLEEDVRAWRKMAEFLIEKDRRTNDDVRRRAAEEPELRARCDQQESALEDAAERLTQLEMELEEKERMYIEAEESGKKWKEATVKLNLELSEAKMKLEKIGKIGIGESDESLHPHGHEFVYRCQWRPNDSNDACEAVFLNISELQEHLFTGGHLQRD